MPKINHRKFVQKLPTRFRRTQEQAKQSVAAKGQAYEKTREKYSAFDVGSSAAAKTKTKKKKTPRKRK